MAVFTVEASEIARVKNENSRAHNNFVLLTAQARDARRLMQSIKEVSEKPDWSILLAAVGQRCGDEVFLIGLDISNISGNPGEAATADAPLTLHISGVGKSAEAISTFVLRLQEINILERVKLVQTARQALGNSYAFSFHLDCTIAGAAGEKHD
jgi:Tfp pilus assembly protein PilN